MTSAKARVNNAILAHQQATAEVERFATILEKAANALARARQTQRDAQKELRDARIESDEAAPSRPRRITRGGSNSAEHVRDHHHASAARSDTDEDPSEYSVEGSEASSGEFSSEEGETEEEEEEGSEEEGSEEDGFDMGNEALEQIRYRLETAKIDPSSPGGTQILDRLLIRLQETKESVAVDANLINKLVDEFLAEAAEPEAAVPHAADRSSKNRLPPQSRKHQQYPRTRIHRGGKALGVYQGQLDARGYARQGAGSMYYDAGHECHGTWRGDEMVGGGVYRWSDGHIYDGEWLNGKRHGLGKFVRPDGVVLYGQYEGGHHKGEGARWSADGREAQSVVDGVPKKTVSLAKAKEIMTNLGFGDVLPPQKQTVGDIFVS